jgi:hypothetical protein
MQYQEENILDNAGKINGRLKKKRDNPVVVPL